MRHQKEGKKFGRKKGDREAFIKGLMHNLIMEEEIETTLIRAKETKRELEKLITLAKKQDLASYRLLLKKLPKKSAEKLFKIIAPRYLEKNGGYLRIIKTGMRKDSSQMAIISFVGK